MTGSMSGVAVRPSPVHGRGVFATRPFDAGDLIERCPVIVVPAHERHLIDATALYDYYFYWADGAAALALGYGSIYNHGAPPNARWIRHFDTGSQDLIATRAIAAEQEITHDYTHGGINPLWFTPRTREQA